MNSVKCYCGGQKIRFILSMFEYCYKCWCGHIFHIASMGYFQDGLFKHVIFSCAALCCANQLKNKITCSNGSVLLTCQQSKIRPKRWCLIHYTLRYNFCDIYQIFIEIFLSTTETFHRIYYCSQHMRLDKGTKCWARGLMFSLIDSFIYVIIL